MAVTEAHLHSCDRATSQPCDRAAFRPGAPADEGGAAPAAAPPGGWLACYTRPRAEKRVDALLAERGIESYLPAVPRLHHWSDRNRTVIVPLFASYVFARGEALGPILETPGVHHIVRFNDRPALIPDTEIRNIERFVQALKATRCQLPAIVFQPGRRVMITAGPFQGVEGVVRRRGTRHRVLVGLAAIDAGFEVDVSARSLVLIPEQPQDISSTAARHPH